MVSDYLDTVCYSEKGSISRVSYKNFSWNVHACNRVHACVGASAMVDFNKFWTYLRTRIVRFSCSALGLYLCCTLIVIVLYTLFYDIIIFHFLRGGGNPSAPSLHETLVRSCIAHANGKVLEPSCFICG